MYGSIPGNWVKPFPWSSSTSLDGAVDFNLVLFGILVGFHLAPPDTSLSVHEPPHQYVVGLTVTQLSCLGVQCSSNFYDNLNASSGEKDRCKAEMLLVVVNALVI